MPGHRLTQSQYAHQRVVEHFGDLIAQLDEQALTYISAVVWSVTISIGIGYPVHQYISTGLLSFEEFSEDSLFPGSVSNGSGPALRVRVRVGTDLVLNGGLGRQYTRTVNSGTVRWTFHNPSELGGLSAGCPAGPSVDSYNALVFCFIIIVCYQNRIFNIQ